MSNYRRGDPETGCALMILAVIVVFVAIVALILLFLPEIERLIP